MAKRAHSKDSVQREPKEFEEEVVEISRVTKVVKGGRRLRFRATVVIGNKKGKVGIGIGKSNEVTGAIQKAIARAKKHLVNIILDDTTIPHQVRIKFKASDILLMPAAPGTGIIAGSTIRKVIELAGIKDILSKCFGTTNKISNVKATLDALKSLKTTPFMELKAKKNAEKKETQAAQAAKPQPQPTPKKEELKEEAQQKTN
ncbi:30S ribosomal protein S5 [Candidatus Peregrinibacteria bacterium]|nr:30S ribosomal protein S5 [Candidatus Peregrinibacteria bacterium]